MPAFSKTRFASPKDSLLCGQISNESCPQHLNNAPGFLMLLHYFTIPNFIPSVSVYPCSLSNFSSFPNSPWLQSNDFFFKVFLALNTSWKIVEKQRARQREYFVLEEQSNNLIWDIRTQFKPIQAKACLLWELVRGLTIIASCIA